MRKYIYAFLISGVLLSLVSCKEKQDNAQAMMGGPQITPVSAIKLPVRDITTYQIFPTSIEGVVNSAARPKIAGYITEVLVDEGQRVKKGQVLFRLETSTLSQEAEAAKANINAAQVQVDQLRPLVEKNIISENQLATAEARLSQAKASYNSVRANIGYATVTSPVDGYVGQIRTRRGLVSPSDPQPLTTISEISQVYAYFSMNEKDYLNFLKTAEGETRQEKIKNLPKVHLVMANGDEYPHEGVIETVNSQVDKSTGSVSFRAIFDNPEQLLTNGSTGQIKVPEVNKGVVVVPQKSTFERQGRTYVMKVENADNNTLAVQTAVEVKDGRDNLFLVTSGIKEGDMIVAEGVDRLRDKTPIMPNEMSFDSIAKPLKAIFK